MIRILVLCLLVLPSAFASTVERPTSAHTNCRAFMNLEALTRVGEEPSWAKRLGAHANGRAVLTTNAAGLQMSWISEIFGYRLATEMIRSSTPRYYLLNSPSQVATAMERDDIFATWVILGRHVGKRLSEEFPREKVLLSAIELRIGKTPDECRSSPFTTPRQDHSYFTAILTLAGESGPQYLENEEPVYWARRLRTVVHNGTLRERAIANVNAPFYRLAGPGKEGICADVLMFFERSDAR